MNAKIAKFLFALLCTVQISFVASAAIDENPEAVKALSKCLKATNATMYGAKNCGHCNAQKEMFGPYFKNIRFVDCRSSSNASEECREKRVGKFPQWNFQNGRTIVREADLETIAEASGCKAYVAQALAGSAADSALPAANDSSPNNNQAVNSNKASSRVSASFGSPEDLAQCLKAKGVKFYGSPKCSHCNKQKEMFQGAFERYLSSNFHNCKGSAKEQAECSQRGTFPFPTWVEPSTGKKLLGPEHSLEQIARAFNCTAADTGRLTQEDSTETTKAVNKKPSNEPLDYYTPKIQPSRQASPDREKSSSVLENNQKLLAANTASSALQATYANERSLLEQRQNKLADCLSNRKITLYGITDESKGKTVQFKATQDQLTELGNASKQIKVVDCSAGQAECSGILVYPTWILDNKNELAGVYELSNLAQILQCPIDQ